MYIFVFTLDHLTVCGLNLNLCFSIISLYPNTSGLIFPNKPGEKAGGREQKENQQSEVAGQAEEFPSGTPTEDLKNSQSEDVNGDISADPEQTASQPNPIRKHPGRGRPPKSSQVSAQKTVSVKEEEEGSLANTTGFQDDPSDADYAPSKNIFIRF